MESSLKEANIHIHILMLKREYKNCKTLFKKIKKVSRKNYYSQKLIRFQNSVRKTW